MNMEKLTEEINKGKKNIIGKLHSDRVISKEIIRSSMLKIWKTTSPLLVLDIHQNTFIFLFDSEEDMS